MSILNKNLSAHEVFNLQVEKAKSYTQKLIVNPDNMKDFSGVRQGDVNIVRLGPFTTDEKEIVNQIKALKSASEKETTLKTLSEVLGEVTENRQLVPGTTQGSRHCVVDGVTARVPGKGSNELHGPILSSKDRFSITHPEHSHHSLPAGNYQVTFQRDFQSEELARIRD